MVMGRHHAIGEREEKEKEGEREREKGGERKRRREGERGGRKGKGERAVSVLYVCTCT